MTQYKFPTRCPKCGKVKVEYINIAVKKCQYCGYKKTIYTVPKSKKGLI